jgi:hypothetical protein
MVPRHKNFLESGIWIVNEVASVVSGTLTAKDGNSRSKQPGDKKSGLKAVTLIAAPNPVSQVLW